MARKPRGRLCDVCLARQMPLNGIIHVRAAVAGLGCTACCLARRMSFVL
jgi:hypothetical protein